MATGVQQSPVDGEILEQNESSTDRAGAVLDHDQPRNKSKGIEKRPIDQTLRRKRQRNG